MTPGQKECWRKDLQWVGGTHRSQKHGVISRLFCLFWFLQLLPSAFTNTCCQVIILHSRAHLCSHTLLFSLLRSFHPRQLAWRWPGGAAGSAVGSQQQGAGFKSRSLWQSVGDNKTVTCCPTGVSGKMLICRNYSDLFIHFLW